MTTTDNARATITIYLPFLTLQKIDRLRKEKSRNGYICDIVVRQVDAIPENNGGV